MNAKTKSVNKFNQSNLGLKRTSQVSYYQVLHQHSFISKLHHYRIESSKYLLLFVDDFFPKTKTKQLVVKIYNIPIYSIEHTEFLSFNKIVTNLDYIQVFSHIKLHTSEVEEMLTKLPMQVAFYTYMYTAKFIGIPQSSAYRSSVYSCNF